MTGDKDLKIWEGIYQSFADARGDTGVFEQNVWLEKVMDRARSALTASRGDVSIAPVAETREYALPFIAAVAAQRGVRLRILDFGGGLGSSFIPLVKMLPTGQELEFVIVENEAICKAGDELFANDSRVRFRSDIPPSDEHYEIVHCGSSIHYVDDWIEVLGQFSRAKPQYMIFADLPAAENKSFVTTQKYYGSRIPVRFWNIEEFKSQVCSFGYRLVMQSRYHGAYLDKVSLPVFPESECDLAYFSQLVFRSVPEAGASAPR